MTDVGGGRLEETMVGDSDKLGLSGIGRLGLDPSLCHLKVWNVSLP